MRTLLVGLEEAFHYFGGVPRELLFDQMEAVITNDLRLDGGALIHNSEFLRFAAHWDFTPRPCRPYRAKTRGNVEHPIGYVRGNFVNGWEFLDDADLDHQRHHMDGEQEPEFKRSSQQAELVSVPGRWYER